MVGVGGRSKGCHTCKKRKIACSLEKPTCATCAKSNRICGGYERNRVFVLDQRTQAVVSKRNIESEMFETLPRQDPLKIESQLQQSIQATIPTKNAYASLRAISSLSTRAVYREQILCEFLYSYQPARQAPQPPSIGLHGSGNWFTMLPTLPEITTALEASVLAICTARLGRIHNDFNLVHESQKFYTQALRELQRALWSPSLMYRDETLAACTALVIYEAVECPDRSIKGWADHTRGCAKLCELRGPGAYGSEFAHQLFLSISQIEIQQALTQKRRTFLSDSQWAKLPWKGFKKEPPNQLLELMAEMSNLIATAYELFDPANMVEPTAAFLGTLEIVKRCWQVDAKLSAFYDRFERETDGPTYWSELSSGFNGSVINSIDGCVFPVAFHFSNMRVAYTCMSYWATCSILWSGMLSVYAILASFQTVSEPNLDGSPCTPTGFHIGQLPPLEHRTDISTLAKYICQCLEYSFKDEAAGAGPTLCVFPMKVAIESLHSDPGCVRELEWAEAAMSKISENGMRIMSNLGISLSERVYLPG